MRKKAERRNLPVETIRYNRIYLATPWMESAANGRLAALRTNDAVQPRASWLADSVESNSLD
jgi:hypothetical protein